MIMMTDDWKMHSISWHPWRPSNSPRQMWLFRLASTSWICKSQMTLWFDTWKQINSIIQNHPNAQFVRQGLLQAYSAFLHFLKRLRYPYMVLVGGCPRVRQRYHSWEIHSFWFVITSDYWLIHRGHQQLGLYLGDPWGACLQFITYPVVHGVHRYPWSVWTWTLSTKTYTTSPAFPLHFPSWKRTCSMWSKEKGTTKLSLSFGP